MEELLSDLKQIGRHLDGEKERERQGKEDDENYAEKRESVADKDEQLKMENVLRKRAGRYRRRMIET